MSTESALGKLRQGMLAIWPEHERFLEKSFTARTPAQVEDSEFLAGLILRIKGENLAEFFGNYRWTCEQLTAEELSFRRTDRYRFASAAEVRSFVYDNADYMNRYLDGLLLSQLFWHNHAAAFSSLRREFLPANPAGYSHLEIGPGHGLLTFLAAADPKCVSCSAWDISPAALAEVKTNMRLLNPSTSVDLDLHDLAEPHPAGQKFDGVVLSEVLEHVENPQAMLKAVRGILKPTGRIFVNFPVNSPAIDHIVLLRRPEEVVSLVESAGFSVVDSKFFPMTGMSLERARKMDATISCVVTATAP
jgi:2-polyprenyl-3-methyl-5-hydroxy-6-metoxy-1,4-benzoquinol methylase